MFYLFTKAAKSLKKPLTNALHQSSKHLKDYESSTYKANLDNVRSSMITHVDNVRSSMESQSSKSSKQNLASSIDHIISELAQLRIKINGENELFSDVTSANISIS